MARYSVTPATWQTQNNESWRNLRGERGKLLTNKIYQNLSARRCVDFCAHLRPPDYKNKPFVTWDPPGKAKSIRMYV